MREIETLQERIGHRCRARAKTEAQRLWMIIPYVDDLKVYHAASRCELTITSDNLRVAMLTAMENSLYVKYVNDECRKLLETIDQLDALTEEVNNLQQGKS